MFDDLHFLTAVWDLFLDVERRFNSIVMRSIVSGPYFALAATELWVTMVQCYSMCGIINVLHMRNLEFLCSGASVRQIVSSHTASNCHFILIINCLRELANH